MDLKRFVEICNKCDCKAEENPDLKDSAYNLAQDFDAFIAWEEKSHKRVLDYSKDDYDQLLFEMDLEPNNDRKENLGFYMCLRKMEKKRDQFKDGYEFLWDKEIKAEVNVWAPFDDGILSQKWHVLISLLAFLDTAANDQNYILSGGNKRWSYCKTLIGITQAYDDCRQNKNQNGKEIPCVWIDYAKNGYIRRRRFPSILMNQWLQEAICIETEDIFNE